MSNWLGTWKHRKKINIDKSDIGKKLRHFPLAIPLGEMVGKNKITDLDYPIESVVGIWAYSDSGNLSILLYGHFPIHMINPTLKILSGDLILLLNPMIQSPE